MKLCVLLLLLSLHVFTLGFRLQLNEFNILNVDIKEVCELKKAGASYLDPNNNIISESSRTHEEYSNEWTVKIVTNSNVEEIAERNGFINQGLVHTLKINYRFYVYCSYYTE